MILTVPRDTAFFPTLGPQVCDFIEGHLVFGPGDVRGTPAQLDDEKRALVYRCYEVFPQGHELAGRRRFKRCAISLRKGSAKTEFAAWIAACELHPAAPVRCIGWDRRGHPIGGPVTDPYIPLVAYTEEQTEDLAYGALRVILQLAGMGLKGDGTFDIGLERILRKGGDGKAVALATAPDARDGARTTFQHFDEPLALDTRVPTTSGWKTIGEIQPGDEVFGRTGAPARVVGVSEVKHDRPCFRLTFDNGTSLVTDGDHRWTVIDWRNRPRGECQRSTGQMYAAGVETGYGKRWRLPRAAGFDGVEATLPIDPYLLGLWLGDGSTDAGYINTGARDYAPLAEGFIHSVSHDARPGVVRWLPTGLRGRLRRAGLLGAKHIPAAYLCGSRPQRLELLRGLMDSDGHTTEGGGCTFVQKGRPLCEQVAVLVRSLGACATIASQRDPRSRTGWMFKVHFTPAFQPFRLRRKAEAAPWCVRRCTSWPAIVAIEPVPSVPVRCLAVDTPDHLFLVGDGLHLTHNTHRFTLPRLVRAHQSMLANIPKRRLADPWSLETTTAPEPGSGSVAEATMEYARQVGDGHISDSRLFFFHREASAHHDLDTEAGVRAAVIEASGPVAAWSDVDSIVEQWRDPTTDRAYFERVWLNRLVKSSTQAFDVVRWGQLEQPQIVPRGTLITLGFDGSQTRDGTALVATAVESGYQWLAGLWEQPAGAAGETWRVPTEEVDALVRYCFAEFQVWRLYADPPFWQEWTATWAGDAAIGGGDVSSEKQRVVEWFTNRRKAMSAALENFQTAIAAGTIHHDGDPRYTRHLGNSRKAELRGMLDDHGRPLWVIQKDRPDSVHKIDAAMAGVLSWQARTDAIASGATQGHDFEMIIIGRGR